MNNLNGVPLSKEENESRRNLNKKHKENEDSQAGRNEKNEGNSLTSNDLWEELASDAGANYPPDNLLLEEEQSDEPTEQQNIELEYEPDIPQLSPTEFNFIKPKTYELEKFEKNIMLIFNQFDVPGYEHRHGTEKDVDALKKTFEPLGFECTVYDDKNKSVILKLLEKEIQNTDFTNIGCLIVCILTHGESNGKLWARDETYYEIDVLKYFNGDNKTLITKPRLLILQACRGTKSRQAAKVRQLQPTFREDHKKEAKHYHLLLEADVLVVHSCALNTPAFRCMENGSWLIQAICSHVNELAATEDMASILLEVKKTVSTQKHYRVPNTEDVILTQMPVVTSTLTRNLNFHRADVVVKEASSKITPLISKIPDDVTSHGSRMRTDDTTWTFWDFIKYIIYILCWILCVQEDIFTEITSFPPSTTDDVTSIGNMISIADTTDITSRCLMENFIHTRNFIRLLARNESDPNYPIAVSLLELADNVTEGTDIETVTRIRNVLLAYLRKPDILESHLRVLQLDYEH